MKPAVVVTGVSSGIGQAACRALVAHGFQVFGSVRKLADADSLTASIGGDFTPLLFDIVDAEAVAAAARQVRGALAGRRLAGLINNAGIAVAGPIAEVPPAALRRQLEVNLVGTLNVTQQFLPLLGKDPDLSGPKGRIVNVSSITGRVATPFLGPYVASKHALEGLSDTMRREFVLFGIDVVIVAPGVVKTPIWGKAENIDIAAYESLPEYARALPRFIELSTAGLREGIDVETIADLLVKTLTIQRPKARYAPMPGGPLQSLLMRILPTRMLDRAIAKRYALSR